MNDTVNKPFKGSIDNWYFEKWLDNTKFILGKFIDHPQFGGNDGHTSAVIKLYYDAGERMCETRNSIYRLQDPFDHEALEQFKSMAVTQEPAQGN